MSPAWHSLRLAAPIQGLKTRWLWLSRRQGLAAVRQQVADGLWTTQALRFRADGWTEPKAREWARAHGYAPPIGWDPARTSTRKGRKNPSSSSSRTSTRSKASPARPAPVELLAYRRRPVEVAQLGGALAYLGELDEVILPAPGWRGWDRYPVRWAVVEAAWLVPSHRPGTYARHPDYPAGVQERDYSPGTRERLKVESQIATFEPRLMLADTPSVIDGPPFVAASGAVLGGNSRTMTIQAVYSGPQERAIAARDALVSYLGRSRVHGDFPRAELLAMRAPVLVRLLQLPPEQQRDLGVLRDLAARANQPLTQALDPRRAASSAAARLPAEQVRAIGEAADPGVPLSEWLTGPGGLAVVAALRAAGVITGRNEPAWLDQAGKLTADGRSMALRTLAAAVIDDAELLDALPSSLLDELAAAGAPIVAAAAWGHDTRPALRAAARYWQAWKASGQKSLEMFARQRELAIGGAWGEVPELRSELEKLCFRVLQEQRGARKFPALWRRFASLAQRNAGEESATAEMFPGERVVLTTEQLLERALEGAGSERENPRAELWHHAEVENMPEVSVSGAWSVPERGAGKLAKKLAGELKLGAGEVLLLSMRDQLGQLTPVARYRPDGRRLADPALRFVNPSLPAPAEHAYLEAAAARAVPELRGVLEQLSRGKKQASAPAWRQVVKARRYLQAWAREGGVRYPWGVAATAHILRPSIVRLEDALGWCLELAGDLVAFGKCRQGPWLRPNPRTPATAREYFLRHLKAAVEPWRPVLVLLAQGEAADQVGRVQGLFALSKLAAAHDETGRPLYPWGVPASPAKEGTGKDTTWRLTDGAGYGVWWQHLRDQAGWFGPPPPPEEE